MSVRSETLDEVIKWLKAQADSEWECAKDGLSDTYGANDANLRNVTLVVADGNKVGLYKADGKALKPVGKD